VSDPLQQLFEDALDENRSPGRAAKVAKTLDVSAATVSRWKSGARPRPERWAEIEEAFGWEPGTIRSTIYGAAEPGARGPYATVEAVEALAAQVEQLTDTVGRLVAQLAAQGEREASRRARQPSRSVQRPSR